MSNQKMKYTSSSSSSISCTHPKSLVEFGHVTPKFQRDICQQVYTPSWSIDSKYSHGTLINNWSEERRKFNHDAYFQPFPKSTTTRDFRPPCDAKYNFNDREKYAIRMQQGAIPNYYFFRHHGKRHECNNISFYDELYNRRRLTDENGLMRFPEERKWSVIENEWRPEASDYPLQGDGTNWGLLESKIEERRRLKDHSDQYLTIYRKSYGHQPAPGDYTLTRYATPRELSFKYNKQDLINRDTDFARGKQPERLWHVEKSSGLCEPRHPIAPLYD